MAREIYTYLEPSDKKSVCHQLCIAVGPVLEQCKDAPSNIEEWDQPVHWQPGKQKHKWNLSKHSADDIYRLQVDEFIAVESQVFLETSDICII